MTLSGNEVHSSVAARLGCGLCSGSGVLSGFRRAEGKTDTLSPTQWSQMCD